MDVSGELQHQIKTKNVARNLLIYLSSTELWLLYEEKNKIKRRRRRTRIRYESASARFFLFVSTNVLLFWTANLIHTWTEYCVCFLPPHDFWFLFINFAMQHFYIRITKQIDNNDERCIIWLSGFGWSIRRNRYTFNEK